MLQDEHIIDILQAKTVAIFCGLWDGIGPSEGLCLMKSVQYYSVLIFA